MAEDFVSLHRRASETMLALATDGDTDDCVRILAKLETIVETEQRACKLAVNDLQRKLATGLIELAERFTDEFKECL